MPRNNFYPNLSVHRQTFTGGMNSDLADEKMRTTMARIFLNCRSLSTDEGNEGDVVTNKGNVLITTPLPSGTNEAFAKCCDEDNNRILFGVWNSNNLHTWFIYDVTNNNITQLLQNLTDTDNVDIFGWDINFPVISCDIVAGNLLYYCDGRNKARKLNIKKLLDKTSTGYGYSITEDLITAFKACPVYAPKPYYDTDTTTNSNLVYALLFKFVYRFRYADGEISNYSDLGTVALPPNQSYLGAQAVTTDNNVIQVPLETGSLDVAIIEVAMLQSDLADWQTCAILNKDDLGIADNSTYVFSFYNNGSYDTADQGMVARANNYIFRVPWTQAFVEKAMTYTGGAEGFDNVKVNIGVVAGANDLYIPSGTDNEMNHPAITITQVSYVSEKSLFKVVRYDPTIQFIVGGDVRKGNVFTITGTNGPAVKGPPLSGGFDHVGANNDRYYQTFTASAEDDSVSMANRIISWLRGIGRGIPDALDGITGPTVDGSNNVTFYYSYKGQWRQNITKFSGTVTPVSFISLMNNGVSIKVIKSGSVRQYAVGYENDIQQKSPSYTSDEGKVRTPFLTEYADGKLKQPFHTVSIMHQPPIWARKWILYRTPDEVDFIQLLIQKVIEVTVTTANDNGVYLDLVVGSLATYNAIHSDSILAYLFKRGDRLRLIRNQNTMAYYTPFYETSILSYQEVTTEQVNAQITVDPGGHGSDHVVPSDGVRPDYVGKNIQIGGYERTIIGIDGGDYVLDQVLNIGTTLAETVEPSYTFIDRRGIVRIAKPPTSYNVADLSTVELYTPKASAQNLNYTEFVDTGMKFDIIDAGLPTRAHAGSHQNQDGTTPETLISTPAEIVVTEGDVYIRDRAMPANNTVINTQEIVDAVEDPNFSDFYKSTLNDLGRVFPTDPNPGVTYFGSRVRFSNNYIQDTKINGLNDFNDLDREDYDDLNGDIMLTRYVKKRLMAFKRLIDAWIPIFQSILVDQAGQQVVGISDKLLNPMRYYEFDGGIGSNPESWFISEEGYQYHAMPMKGVFVRLAGDGIIPISKLYGYDTESRGILNAAQKYRLRVPGGIDPVNGEPTWSMKNYIEPLFSAQLNETDWNIFNDAVPDGSTVVIDTQPANGVVPINGAGDFVVTMNAGFVGDDSFTYHFIYPGGALSDTINECISVTPPPPSPTGFRLRASTAYCVQIDGSLLPNTFDIENTSTTTFLGIPDVTFNAASIGGAAISAGSHDVLPAPAGGNPSELVVKVGTGYRPSSATLTATGGMTPINASISGSLPGTVLLTFSGIDAGTYHDYTVTITQ